MPGISQVNDPAEAKLVGQNDVLPMLAPAGGLKSGQVVTIAGKAGVVLSDVVEGELVGVDISRTFLFPNTGVEAVIGTQYAWNDTTKLIVATTTGDFELGIAVPTNDNPGNHAAGAGAAIALNLMA